MDLGELEAGGDRQRFREELLPADHHCLRRAGGCGERGLE
jgi:hypothetical protein